MNTRRANRDAVNDITNYLGDIMSDDLFAMLNINIAILTPSSYVSDNQLASVVELIMSDEIFDDGTVSILNDMLGDTKVQVVPRGESYNIVFVDYEY